MPRFQKLSALPRLALSSAAALVRHQVSRRRTMIVVSAILVCAYAVGVLGYVMVTPEIGIRSAFYPVVNNFDTDFLWPDNQEPLRENDRIVQLGDQPISNWAQILHKLAHLRRRAAEPGDLAKLKDDRRTHLIVEGQEIIKVQYQRGDDETVRSVWCRVGRAPVETLAPSVLWFLLKIGLFVVGALVFWKRPEDHSAAVFFLFCLASFGAYIGGFHWSRITTQPVLLLGFILCSVMLPAVSLHFYLLFPRPKRLLARYPQRVLLALYGPPLLFLLLFVTGYFRVRWLYYQPGQTNDVAPLLEEIRREIYCYFAVAAAWYLASIVCLIHSYRSAVLPLERNQVKWILFGSLASLAPIGYSLYLAVVESQRFGGGAGTLPMFFASVCVTVAFTISITRYRLMQLDQLISSGVIYFLISSLVGLLYYGLVFTGMVLLGSQVIEGPSLGQVLSVSFLALVVLVARDLVRDRFQSALNRHFRREKHQLDRTLQRMSQAIEQLVDPPALGRRLLHTSAELLGASRGAVYLRQGEPPLYHLADSIGLTPELAELSSGCPLVEALLSVAPPPPPPQNGGGGGGAAAGQLRLPPLAVLVPGRQRNGRSPSVAFTPAQRQLRFLGGVVAQALLHEGELLGLLLLGSPVEPRGLAPDVAGGYTAEDLNLLTAFAQITALALVGAEGHRKIETLNHELQAKVEKIAEQQRRILALQNQLSAIGHRLSAPAEPPVAASGPLAGGEKLASGPLAATGGDGQAPTDGMIGSSPQVHSLLQLVRKVAATDSVVLLRGESGTGKELLARAIHENSPRAGRPFIKVHCAALSPGLLESELFGHVKGAFTSAIRDKVGRFEAANGGTLFLDEIGDISLEVQIKLLRVLQEKTFERVGSSEPLKVDVRIITATHQDLEALMRQDRFRHDLFYRLNVLPIVLPPLRDRAEDIPELALYFLRRCNQRMNKQVTGIDDDAMVRLKAFPWPGNIRQLENVVEHAMVVAEKSIVTVEELPAELQADPALLARMVPSSGEEGRLEAAVSTPPGLESLLQAERIERDRREREQFVRALAAAGGNKAEAARALGIARSTLVSRLKRLGLS